MFFKLAFWSNCGGRTKSCYDDVLSLVAEKNKSPVVWSKGLFREHAGGEGNRRREKEKSPPWLDDDDFFVHSRLDVCMYVCVCLYC